MYEIGLTHSIDCAHRVYGHEGGKGKCARLHGHTYLYEVTLRSDFLDETGFILDYGEIKKMLDEWDHRCLLWEDDPLFVGDVLGLDHDGVVRLPFNPTAENLSKHVACSIFADHEELAEVRVVVRETPKSFASWTARR